MLLTSGRIFDANKAPIVPGRVLVQNQDSGAMTLATNADDGSGFWSIPSQDASDFTIEAADASLKAQMADFHLSKLPANATYDAARGYIEIVLPFV